MPTLALALMLACGPRGHASGPLFVPAAAMVPMQMPRAMENAGPVRRVVTRTTTRVTRAAFRPLRAAGYLITPWRW